ncbi:MAG: cytochrome c, partial [Proteobacteria bacterium]|nr:cytochrome c [Pseudomonadota bacterium]
FTVHCARCHAPRGTPNGYPNLWNLPAALYDALEPIVLDGALSGAGMPGYADVLGPADVAAIREYLLRDEALYGRARLLE